MVLYKKWITKALIRLRVCAGWSAPVLVANPRRQVFSRRGPFVKVDAQYSNNLRYWNHCGYLWLPSLHAFFRNISGITLVSKRLNPYLDVLSGFNDEYYTLPTSIYPPPPPTTRPHRQVITFYGCTYSISTKGYWGRHTFFAFFCLVFRNFYLVTCRFLIIK